MGLTTPNFPAIEPRKTVMDIPYRERIKRFARHWVDYGFGGPKLFPILYIGKLLTFCVTGGSSPRSRPASTRWISRRPGASRSSGRSWSCG